MRTLNRIRAAIVGLSLAAAGTAAAKTCSGDEVKGVSDWWWEQANAKAEALADWRERTGVRWTRAHDRSLYCVQILGAWQCHAKGRVCRR